MDEDKDKADDTDSTQDSGEGNGKQERTFTQADMDAVITKRLERERARFADFDKFKEAAEKLGKLEEANLTEQEKLKKQLADMEAAAAEKDAQLEAGKLEVNEKLLRAEVRVLAATMDFWDPEEAYKLANLKAAREADDDTGKAQGVKDALKALAKDKAHLIKTALGGGSPGNKSKKAVSKEKRELDEAVAYARRRLNIRDYSPKATGGKDQ